MEEAKRRIFEEIDARRNNFSELLKGHTLTIPKEKVVPDGLGLIKRLKQEEQQWVKFNDCVEVREETEDNCNGKQ